MHTPTNWYWTAAAAAIIGLSGCGRSTRVDEPVWLAVQGPVAVDIESFNGDVSVVAERERQHAMVQVRRRATHGSGRTGDAKAALSRIRYSAEVVPSDTGPTLMVRTWTDDPEPWFLRADVRVFLPIIENVRIRSTNGKVQAENIRGVVDIECAEGDVRVLTNNPLTEAITIVNKNGDIDLRTRGGTSGEFDCHSHGGTVDQRIKYGRVTIHEGTDGDTLWMTLNEGTNPVQLRTVDGDVRISIVDEPLDVGGLIVDP